MIVRKFFVNSEISPIYQSIRCFEKESIILGASAQNRTEITCSSDKRLDHVGNRGIGKIIAYFRKKLKIKVNATEITNAEVNGI